MKTKLNNRIFHVKNVDFWHFCFQIYEKIIQFVTSTVPPCAHLFGFRSYMVYENAKNLHFFTFFGAFFDNFYCRNAKNISNFWRNFEFWSLPQKKSIFNFYMILIWNVHSRVTQIVCFLFVIIKFCFKFPMKNLAFSIFLVFWVRNAFLKMLKM